MSTVRHSCVVQQQRLQLSCRQRRFKSRHTQPPLNAVCSIKTFFLLRLLAVSHLGPSDCDKWWVTYTTFTKETGLCVPFENKRHQSFPDPNLMVFVPKLKLLNKLFLKTFPNYSLHYYLLDYYPSKGTKTTVSQEEL